MTNHAAVAQGTDPTSVSNVPRISSCVTDFAKVSRVLCGFMGVIYAGCSVGDKNITLKFGVMDIYYFEEFRFLTLNYN